MDLRAPLPREHATPKDGSDDMSYPAEYETNAKHFICRMFVACQMMELGSESRFTGLVLFHRYTRHFYRLVAEQKQHKQNDKQEMKQIRQHLGQVAAACLFLGCKMSEEPRRIRDVINLSTVLGFSEDEEDHKSELTVIKELVEPPLLDSKYWATKEEIVSTEQLVLRMLQFDTSVCTRDTFYGSPLNFHHLIPHI